MRFSHLLDYFHDTAERVATAYTADQRLLVAQGYEIVTEISQPGYIRAVVSRDDQATKIE